PMTAMPTPRHRVRAATARMRAIADTVTDASVWSMDSAETQSTLIELTRLKGQVAGLEARVAEHADDGVVAPWGPQTVQTKPAVIGQVKLGEALVARSHVREA